MCPLGPSPGVTIVPCQASLTLYPLLLHACVWPLNPKTPPSRVSCHPLTLTRQATPRHTMPLARSLARSPARQLLTLPRTCTPTPGRHYSKISSSTSMILKRFIEVSWVRKRRGLSFFQRRQVLQTSSSPLPPSLPPPSFSPPPLPPFPPSSSEISA